MSAEANPVTYHPLTALRFLRAILQKLIVEFRAIQDGGSLCIFQRKGSAAQEDQTLDETECKIWELQTLRYPGVWMNEDLADLHRDSLEPHLSFSGYAFALCAASLPLLQSKDCSIVTETVRLVQDALPFVVDVQLSLGEESLVSIHQKRWQHLLNRFDQVRLALLIIAAGRVHGLLSSVSCSWR